MARKIFYVPITPGELVDKITILEIKLEHIGDAKKIGNIKKELAALQDSLHEELVATEGLAELMRRLKGYNLEAWHIIESMEEIWRRNEHVPERIFADAVCVNKMRVSTKQAIDVLLGSDFREEKSYLPAQAPSD